MPAQQARRSHQLVADYGTEERCDDPNEVGRPTWAEEDRREEKRSAETALAARAAQYRRTPRTKERAEVRRARLGTRW